MPIQNGRLTIPPIDAKFDRLYKAAGRDDGTYHINVARLECDCADWRDRRAQFSSDDARRVCAHIYDKLYSTKVERSFDPLAQLFIRYGRTMLDYQTTIDADGTFLIGRAFGGESIRIVGLLGTSPLLATFNLRGNEWSPGEGEISEELRRRLLTKMRSATPSAFRR